jgi:hypothetical protein
VARLAGADSRDALVVLHGRALLSAELHGDLRTALPLVHAEALVLLKPRTGRPGVVTRRAGCHRWSGPNRHCGRRRRGCGPATRRARPNWHANAISRGPWCTAPTRPLSPARWGGVTPVVKVDGRVICTGWPGAVTALVSQRYLARVLAP